MATVELYGVTEMFHNFIVVVGFSLTTIVKAHWVMNLENLKLSWSEADSVSQVLGFEARGHEFNP